MVAERRIKSKKPREKSFKKKILGVLAGLLCFLAVAFMAVTNFRIYQRKAELNRELERLKGELQVLEERNAELKEDVSYTATADFVEETAREQFHLKKPGEEVLVVQTEESKNIPEKQQDQNWWEKLKSIFIK